MRSTVTTIFISALVIFSLAACHRHTIAIKAAISADVMDTLVVNEFQEPLEFGKIGTIITDTSDSAILKLMYGTYYIADGKCKVNVGREYTADDTIIMEVHDRVGDDSTLIVNITGMCGFMKNHTMYYVTQLVLNKVKDGWLLTDDHYYNTQEESWLDYASTRVLGRYCGRVLLSCNYSSGLADEVGYSWMPRHKLDEAVSGVSFLTRESGGDACESRYHSVCEGCKDLSGDVTYSYDQDLKYLIFNYDVTRTSYGCDYSNPHILSTAHQTWYMNADTCFLGRGAIFKADEDWDRITVDSVYMTDSQIRGVLKK